MPLILILVPMLVRGREIGIVFMLLVPCLVLRYFIFFEGLFCFFAQGLLLLFILVLFAMMIIVIVFLVTTNRGTTPRGSRSISRGRVP